MYLYMCHIQHVPKMNIEINRHVLDTNSTGYGSNYMWDEEVVPQSLATTK